MPTNPLKPGGLLAAFAAFGLMALAGCSNSGTGTPAGAKAPAEAPPADAHAAEVKAERDKLSPADRALVDAQEWCAVSTDSRLGSMGPPLKVMVRDQPVFICCKGCQKKAQADPDATFAVVAELKAKAGRERK